MASLFKNYENAMRTGDTAFLEIIEAKFLGIFMLLDKSNYVEIVLSQFEKKYSEIDYNDLHDIRVNSASRYKHCYKEANSDAVSTSQYDFTPYHVLDESMENVNIWVTCLPLND